MKAWIVALLASAGVSLAAEPRLQSHAAWLEETTIAEQAAFRRGEHARTLPACGQVEDGGKYYIKDRQGRMIDQPAQMVAERSTAHIMSGCFTQADLDDMHRRHPRRILCFAGDAGPCVSYNPRIFEILTVEEEPTS
ncbi:MAG: hypothetical protein AAFU68_02960 [Pseudomonadota bacterium]